MNVVLLSIATIWLKKIWLKKIKKNILSFAILRLISIKFPLAFKKINMKKGNLSNQSNNLNDFH